MSNYKGDFPEDAEVTFYFNTVDTDGAPITIGGTAAVEVYKDGGTTQSSAGVTITEDFDGVVGFHKAAVDMSADAFYSITSDYAAVISVGTADSVSIVGGCVAEWSCENRTTTLSTLSANIVQISDDSAAAINLEAYCDGTTPIPANVTTWLGTAAATPTVAGVPEVDITHQGGSAIASSYQVIPRLSRSGANDLWSLAFYKDGAALTGTYGACTITVDKVSDGTAFLTVQPTTFVATNVCRLSTSTQIDRDETYFITGVATVDSVVRTAYAIVSGAELLADVQSVAGTDVTDIDDFKADLTATDAAIATVDSNVDAILVDTSTTIPAAIPTAGAIADQVWDESQAAHTTSGSFGEYLDASVSGVSTGGVSAADIADAVLGEAIADHSTAGSLGKAIADIEADAAAILVDTSTTIPGTIATVDANVDAVLVDTGTTIPAQISALNDVAAADVVTALLDAVDAIEAGVTPRMALRYVLAATVGEASGLGTTTATFKAAENSGTTRITATVDADGNRTSVTLG